MWLFERKPAKSIGRQVASSAAWQLDRDRFLRLPPFGVVLDGTPAVPVVSVVPCPLSGAGRFPTLLFILTALGLRFGVLYRLGDLSSADFQGHDSQAKLTGLRQLRSLAGGVGCRNESNGGCQPLCYRAAVTGDQG